MVMNKVKFEYMGNTYEMYPDEIMAAYRYQERQFKLEDAETQMGCMKDWEGGKFYENRGTTYEEAKENIEEIVDHYDHYYDCDASENDMWEEAIKHVIGKYKYWSEIVEAMDDTIREMVHFELAPCTKAEFLNRYLEVDKSKSFRKLLHGFGII